MYLIWNRKANLIAKALVFFDPKFYVKFQKPASTERDFRIVASHMINPFFDIYFCELFIPPTVLLFNWTVLLDTTHRFSIHSVDSLALFVHPGRQSVILSFEFASVSSCVSHDAEFSIIVFSTHASFARIVLRQCLSTNGQEKKLFLSLDFKCVCEHWTSSNDNFESILFRVRNEIAFGWLIYTTQMCAHRHIWDISSHAETWCILVERTCLFQCCQTERMKR